MRVEFLAHASFLFTDERGLKFMTDPYEAGGFSGRVGYDPIDEAPDVIIITHDHLDHSHTATIPGEFEVVRHAGTPHGVPVRSVQVFHDMFQGTRFGGVIDLKVFTIDGITICHCGDMDGDGIPDVVLGSQDGSEICVYRNENGGPGSQPPVRHFTHVNYTMY